MKLRFIFLILLSFLFESCLFFVTPDKNLLRFNKWDYLNIPDKYNTGARESTDFKKITGNSEIAPNINLIIRTDTNPNFYCLTSYRNSLQNFPDSVTIRDYDFSDYNFIVQGSDRYPKSKHITFENCKFKGFRNDAAAYKSSRIYFTFNHCSFGGGVNSAYITLNDCKIGGFTSDAMNPLREVYANNLYIYNLVTEHSDKELHIDGIQIYGDQRSINNQIKGKWYSKVETGEIHYKNVRFEIPSIYFDGNTSYVNACVMFQLEFSDVNNVSFENLYVNGGGKWFPLYMDYGKNNEKSEYGRWGHKNLLMKDVMVSDNFGKIFYPQLLDDATIINVEHHDWLFVTSAWKDADGTAHLIVTNDTKADKVLTVKSDAGTFDLIVPHCPSNWALGGEINTQVKTDEGLKDSRGKSYKTYTWSDMPFDLDYKITGNPTFLLCYQNDEQIRYFSLDGKAHYYSQIRD